MMLVNFLHPSCNPVSEVLITPGEAKRAAVPLLTWKPGTLNCFCSFIQIRHYCPSHPNCPAALLCSIPRHGRQRGRVEKAGGRRFGRLGSSPLHYCTPKGQHLLVPGAVRGFLPLLVPVFPLARSQKVPGVIEGCGNLGSLQHDGAKPCHPISPGQGSRRAAAALGRGVKPTALQGEQPPPPDTDKQTGPEMLRGQ